MPRSEASLSGINQESRADRFHELGWTQVGTLWPIELHKAVEDFCETEGAQYSVTLHRFVAEGLERNGVELPERVKNYLKTQEGFDEARRALAAGPEASVDYLMGGSDTEEV